MNFETAREFAEKTLSAKRFRHTEGVAHECEYIASLLNLPPAEKQKLLTAAYLHDITKELSLQEQADICKKYNIAFDPTDPAQCNIIHSKTGAYFARSVFPDIIEDEIFGAISFHTTGHDKMTLFEAVVCLSDFIEESRTYEECTRLRNIIHSSKAVNNPENTLYDTLRQSFDITIQQLIERGLTIDNDTVMARNYLVKKRGYQKNESK